METSMLDLSKKNKLHINWEDKTFLPWLNPNTVLDYFCNTSNPFYNSQCSNQTLRMQGVGPEHLTNMVGLEYQLHLSQPPLYVIRKVERTSPRDVVPLSYYYILHGTVYQAPDLMSVISSRLQTSSFYLNECLESAFDHYKYHPSKDYYWDFNPTEESSTKDANQEKFTGFQRERVEFLIQEFMGKFSPYKASVDGQAPPQQTGIPGAQPAPQATKTAEASAAAAGANANDAKNSDQPVEKKMKLNSR